MSGSPIYLDYAATTPVDDRVIRIMQDYLGGDGAFGNPASNHSHGLAAAAAMATARRQLAATIGAGEREIIWTSGATEADNLALKGTVQGAPGTAHVVTANTEHKAVTDTCRALEAQGVRVTWLAADENGRVDPDAVVQALRDDTAIVSAMYVNNETGVIHDIAAIGRALQGHDCLFHVDAVQALGRLPIDVDALGVDLMSFSGHKIYGPKGVGVLYVRRSARARLGAQIHGGGHELGLRAGTLPTHQVAGMGEAARLAIEDLPRETARIGDLSARFLNRLEQLPGMHLNGHCTRRVPHIVNLAFDGVDGGALMADLAWRGRGLSVSSGAACSSATRAPSHVLHSMGLSDGRAEASVRFSLGRFTTAEEVEAAGARVTDAVERLRRISPFWRQGDAA
jgi:cysteine desulfurase